MSTDLFFAGWWILIVGMTVSLPLLTIGCIQAVRARRRGAALERATVAVMCSGITACILTFAIGVTLPLAARIAGA